MYFKKLSMHGFKSFADPISIDFDKGITCIVGPNGSGKSNISDALRWVLGEQSPRMLRGGKMDEIIFAGTDTRKSRGMAEVSLVIDNAEKKLPIDFNEVVITRRMYRSGESEYFINDTQCRLRDVRDLIMDTGIGVDGYSIIGQGKISDIINGRPENRREIFEEAAGIVKYRNKKAETERKLESTSNNLVRVNDIISELEGRVGVLREESRKAKDYLEVSKKYRENEINVILKNIDLADKQTVILQKDFTDAAAMIAESEKKLEEFDSKIRKNKARSDELDEEDLAERERMMNAAYELNDLRNSIKLDNERIASLKQSCTLFSDEIKSLTERIVREENAKKSFVKEHEEIASEFERINKSQNELSKKLADEEKEEKEKQSEFEQHRDALYDISMKLSSKKAEYEGLQNVLGTLKSRLEVVKAETEPDDPDDSQQKAIIEAQRAMEAARSRSVRAAEEVIQIKKKIVEFSNKVESGSVLFDKVRASLNEEKTKKEMLEQLENSYEGYNYAVRFIMKESNIRGLYGTVGELIKAPRGYEIAVETALGARLQNIICESDESANNAIRSLKVRKAGRLTFLPVNSLRVLPRRNDDEISSESGFVGIAADCVEYDPKYKNAIEYLLGGIVIVKTLGDAISISKSHRGYRFVTLEGELINPSGAITGGAYRSNNTAGILERKNRLNASDKLIFELADDCSRKEKALARLRDEIGLFEENLRTAESQQHEAEIEALKYQNEHASLSERSALTADRKEKNKRELTRLEHELERTNKLIADAAGERDGAESRIEDIRKRAEMAADERDSIRRTIAGLSEKLTKVKIEIETIRGRAANLEEKISRSELHIEDLKKELETKELNIRNTVSEQESLRFRISGTQQEIEMSELNNRDQNNRLGEIKQEKAERSKEYDSLLSAKESLDKTLYTQKSRKYDIELKLKSGQTRIEDWKNKLWDDFEISYLEALDLRQPAFDLNEGVKSSRSMRVEMRNLGDVNVNAIGEYEEVKTRYDFLTAQRKDLNEATASLNSIIKETDNLIRTNFEVTFNSISRQFKRIFTELFNGGKAEIHLEQGVDPLDADIDIIVQPPGKKLQNMNLLSGGEKTLTAIALMFAVLKTKPTPFCIMDEVEAALDEANIVRFADYLRNLDNIQFVLVTHQKVTMEHANVLYGITMPEKGISKVLSLKLADAEQIGTLE